MSRISANTSICMIIGDPVGTSLSPIMHNAGYAAAGLDPSFVYVAARVSAESLGDAVRGVRALGVRGVSVTMPHKHAIAALLDRVDESAAAVGAVNTVVNDRGVLTGYNTDWVGVVVPLESRRSLAGARVAVLGAGGAARAAAYGLGKKGAKVTFLNRNVERSRVVAAELGAAVGEQGLATPLAEFDVVVNTTPVGMSPRIDETPVPIESLRKGHLVFDTVYAPHETSLLRGARSRGADVVHGIEMLLHQGIAQFELFTQRTAPAEAMKDALCRHLGITVSG